MTRIIKQHIRQVSRRLIKPRGLTVKSPRLAGSPGPAAGRVFEPGSVEPVHAMDHVFCAEVVADEVLVAAEEEDGHVGEEGGEEVD